MEDAFKKIVANFPRIAIGGGPKVGKTTLSEQIDDRHICHTDDFIGLSWDAVPDLIIDDVKGLNFFVVEGVQVARALRRGLIVDLIVWLETPHVPLNKAQEGMRKGCESVFSDYLLAVKALRPKLVRVRRGQYEIM